MEESWPRSPVQTERSEVCASNRGQDSPIQTDLQARLIRCLLYGQTIKQRNKNINSFVCFPARDQVFSWIWQSKADKSNCSKSSFVQTSSILKTKFFIQAQWKSHHRKRWCWMCSFIYALRETLPEAWFVGLKTFCCVVVEVLLRTEEMHLAHDSG